MIYDRVFAQDAEMTDSQLHFSVQDTGVGIPDAELPHIFERFHRVEGAKGRTYEGSGIGLALIQDLVKLHGGSVSASSRIGEGSIFRVVIPLGSAHLPADRVSPVQQMAGTTAVRPEAYTQEALTWLASSPQLSTTVGSAGTKARILLVDDNADMREHVGRSWNRNTRSSL